jgi:hypothetical protein
MLISGELCAQRAQYRVGQCRVIHGSSLDAADQGVGANRLPAPKLAVGDRTHAHDFIEQRLWRVGKGYDREDRDSGTVGFHLRGGEHALQESVKLLAGQAF